MPIYLKINWYAGLYLISALGLVACSGDATQAPDISGGGSGLSSGGNGSSTSPVSGAGRMSDSAGGGAGRRATGTGGQKNGSGGRVAASQGGSSAITSAPGSGGAGVVTAGAGAGDISQSTVPCPGATQTITVAADGSGQYKTLQAAINTIPRGNSKLVEVDLKAGTYDEQVKIDKPFVCLAGESTTSTIITNTNGTNISTGGTVMVTANDFSAANITFRNSARDGAGQAVALMAQGQRQQFVDCRFVSYQDTVYTVSGTQYFKNCYIQGNTDYIFGDATAVFDRCTINNVSEGTAVTAPSTPQNVTYGLVFIGGELTADPTTSKVRAGSVRLGRPWRPFGAAAYIGVAMGAHIAADGWTTMSANTLANTRFCEYKSTGAGANSTNPTRASRQLSDAQAAAYTVKNVLSPWTPTYSQ
jgi:pectin methylesterase-like acyl-CoA thioesterase